MKSVKLLMHAVVQNPNLKRFLWNSSRCTRRQWWPIQIAPIRSRWVEFTQSNIGSNISSTTVDDISDADQTLSVAKSAAIDD